MVIITGKESGLMGRVGCAPPPGDREGAMIVFLGCGAPKPGSTQPSPKETHDAPQVK